MEPNPYEAPRGKPDAVWYLRRAGWPLACFVILLALYVPHLLMMAFAVHDLPTSIRNWLVYVPGLPGFVVTLCGGGGQLGTAIATAIMFAGGVYFGHRTVGRLVGASVVLLIVSSLSALLVFAMLDA